MSRFKEYLEMAEEKSSKYGSKKTETLILSDKEFEKMKPDMEKVEEGQFMFKDNFKAGGFSWKVGVIKIGNKNKLFGYSGDFGFGVHMTFMQNRNFGNIKPAKEIIKK